VVPQFLAQSFEMLRESQSKMMENMGPMGALSQMPGVEAMQAQQRAFLKAMTGGVMGTGTAEPESGARTDQGEGEEDLDEIKAELAKLQEKLAKMGK
jgi:polyhydroxyalkanoate synthesis regulator protein